MHSLKEINNYWIKNRLPHGSLQMYGSLLYEWHLSQYSSTEQFWVSLIRFDVRIVCEMLGFPSFVAGNPEAV